MAVARLEQHMKSQKGKKKYTNLAKLSLIVFFAGWGKTTTSQKLSMKRLTPSGASSLTSTCMNRYFLAIDQGPA